MREFLWGNSELEYWREDFRMSSDKTLELVRNKAGIYAMWQVLGLAVRGISKHSECCLMSNVKRHLCNSA